MNLPHLSSESWRLRVANLDKVTGRLFHHPLTQTFPQVMSLSNFNPTGLHFACLSTDIGPTNKQTAGQKSSVISRDDDARQVSDTVALSPETCGPGGFGSSTLHPDGGICLYFALSKLPSCKLLTGLAACSYLMKTKKFFFTSSAAHCQWAMTWEGMHPAGWTCRVLGWLSYK